MGAAVLMAKKHLGSEVSEENVSDHKEEK